MGLPNRIEGDMFVDGNLSAKGLTVPAGSVSDTNVAAGAPGSYIAAEKVRLQAHKLYTQNGPAVAEDRAIYRSYGLTGTVLTFVAGSIVAAIGADTVTVDCKKNGTSILAAPITLNSSNTARVAASATLATTTVVAGDLFEVVVITNHTSGTLPSGIFAELVLDEDPQ